MAAHQDSTDSAADRIRGHLQTVFELRHRSATAGTAEAVKSVKRLQALRFASTYADYSRIARSAPAVRFFLNELYGEHDFSRRDQQFGRIAGALERMFPPAVSQLAVDLTETHALTETLDHALAIQWNLLGNEVELAERYVRSWRLCGSRDDRFRQLAVVQHMGRELQRLTRMKSLRLALRLMRNPARAAGLDALQQFLESGFDAFAELGDALPFLSAIDEREREWLDALFDEDLEPCIARLRPMLQQGNRER